MSTTQVCLSKATAPHGPGRPRVVIVGMYGPIAHAPCDVLAVG